MAEIIDSRTITYDKKELNAIIRAFKAMDEQAQQKAKKSASALANFLGDRIKEAAIDAPNPRVASKIANGLKVSTTSKIGEIKLGFASQKFSGGATTQFNYANQGGNGLLAGAEFGSKKYLQFPMRSPRFGQRGNTGYFIYPTLRREQSELIRRWEQSFDQILKEW